ncbi:DnaB-like helicase N-terminal domain-containing protein [Streptomyces sp. NPDC050161]|uniref:DnaB-like helicase N-terminal domain-containing protein n=1 Tax=Streptomyces sp. NPDC050161 TaxID=3365604 RepID=UPI003790B69D
MPVPQPVHYAEQALLGALLLDPRHRTTLGPLEPDSFDNHAHGALFAAIRTLPLPDPDQHRTSTTWLDAVLDRARPEAPGLTASYLHTLIQFCPRPGHAAAYAQMIRADHARRTLREHADRLAQRATDTAGPNPAAATLAQVDATARHLEQLARQFAPHPGSLPRTPAPQPPQPAADEDALEEERLLLATATAHPSELPAMRWLHPDDFALPLHGALFQCLTALAHRGDAVDPVTVLWEAQHRGLLTQGIVPGDLLALVSAPAGTSEYWGERILTRALLSRAHAVALHIRAFTDDPANTAHQLITGARRALADLNAVRARWQRTAPGPAQPAGRRDARTPGAARAGPGRPTPPSPAARAVR